MDRVVPFQIGLNGLLMGGDPSYLLSGMILQVPPPLEKAHLYPNASDKGDDYMSFIFILLVPAEA